MSAAVSRTQFNRIGSPFDILHISRFREKPPMAAGASVLVPQTFCVESPPRLHLTRLNSTRRRLSACEAMLRLRQQMEQQRTNICRACSCVACRPDSIEEERSAAAASRSLCCCARANDVTSARLLHARSLSRAALDGRAHTLLLVPSAFNIYS